MAPTAVTLYAIIVLSVNIVLGYSMTEFFEVLPQVLKNAFESTWDMIKKNVVVTMRPPRPRLLTLMSVNPLRLSRFKGDGKRHLKFVNTLGTTENTASIQKVDILENEVKIIRPTIPLLIPKTAKWHFMTWSATPPMNTLATKTCTSSPNNIDGTNKPRYFLKRKNNLYSIPILKPKS